MKTIEELLRNLARPEVLEFGLVTNRLPSVNIGGKFEPVDDEAPSTERLMQMLVTMGGGRHVDALTDKPVQWTTRLDGVGVIAVAAIMRKEVVQARFTVAKREGGGTIRVVVEKSPVATTHPTPSAEPPKSPLSSTQQQVAARASSPQMRAQPSVPMTAVKSTQVIGTPPVPVQPPPVPIAAPTPAAPPPPEDEWDDDDEPTLQTLSPPVSGVPGSAMKAKSDPTHAVDKAAMDRAVALAAKEKADAQPAQEAAASEKAAAVAKATAAKAAQQKAAAAQAAAEKVAKDRAAAAEKAATQAAAEKRAAAEKAAADKAAADAAEKAAAEKKAAATQAAAEKAAHDTAAQLAAEKKTAADEAAAMEKRASTQRAPGPRRISTPTSVDAVEVDSIKKDIGSKPRLESAPGSEPILRARVPSSASLGTSGAPSTAPSIPEKDRPKLDPGATLDSLLGMAVSAQASDLHIVAGRPVLLRVATDLMPRTQPVPSDHVERIAKEIVPARLRESFERDGACDFAVEHPTYGRFRVHVAKQRGGYKVGMRVVPRELPTVAALGLPERLAASVNATRGLVLVTSPTASGKSTTIAALVEKINRETARHIITIEDPIEHLHPRKKGLVSQREVGLHTRSTKARALQSALREDPDVVVVPDVRDADVVRIALTACESGRLVILGMNMPTARIAIDRILDLFDPREEPWVRATLAASLKVVTSQRLVPSTDRTRLHAAFEVLPWSVKLYNLIREGRTHEIPALQQLGPALGVLRLDDALAELVRAQKVTLDVARQLAESPNDLEALSARPRK